MEEEESYDEEFDYRFRISDIDELLQKEREQVSRKNLETSVVQFIKHQELGLEKPRINSLRRFLLSREIFARELAKYSKCFCIEDSNHTAIKCFGYRLREELDFMKEFEEETKDGMKNLRQWEMETLKVK